MENHAATRRLRATQVALASCAAHSEFTATSSCALLLSLSSGLSRVSRCARSSVPRLVAGVASVLLVVSASGACKRASTAPDVGGGGVPPSMPGTAGTAAEVARVGAPGAEADEVGASASSVPLVSRSHYAMGTQIAVSAYTEDEARALEADRKSVV